MSGVAERVPLRWRGRHIGAPSASAEAREHFSNFMKRHLGMIDLGIRPLCLDQLLFFGCYCTQLRTAHGHKNPTRVSVKLMVELLNQFKRQEFSTEYQYTTGYMFDVLKRSRDSQIIEQPNLLCSALAQHSSGPSSRAAQRVRPKHLCERERFVSRLPITRHGFTTQLLKGVSFSTISKQTYIGLNADC